jgi:hypothetical protein
VLRFGQLHRQRIYFKNSKGAQLFWCRCCLQSWLHVFHPPASTLVCACFSSPIYRRALRQRVAASPTNYIKTNYSSGQNSRSSRGRKFSHVNFICSVNFICCVNIVCPVFFPASCLMGHAYLTQMINPSSTAHSVLQILSRQCHAVANSNFVICFF